MLLFIYKKYISDLWDNFIPILILNLGALAPVLFGFSLTTVASFPQSLILPATLGSLVITLILFGSLGPFSWTLSDYRKARKSDFVPNLALGFSDLFWFYGILAFFSAAVWVAVPFYLEKFGNGGILPAGLVLATAFVGILVIPYYFGYKYQKGLKSVPAYKKAFIFVFKNLGFVLLQGLFPLVAVILSISAMQFVVLRDPATINFFNNIGFSVVLGLGVIVLFFLPGPLGYLMFFQTSFRIKALEVDFREKNPGQPLNWKVILAPEQELLDQRSTRRKFKT